MKTKLILSAIITFALFNLANAQNFNPATYQIGKKYPGYIIKPNGDTLNGFIESQGRCQIGGIGSSNQNKCLFYANESDRKPTEKYGAKDLKGYQIADMTYESITYSGGLVKSASNFCLVIKRGRISEYEWYSTKDGFMTMNKNDNETWEKYDQRRYDTKHVFMHKDKKPWELQDYAFGFPKKMSAYIDDYPALSKKVEDKEKGYKMLDVYDIIKEYNEYWAKKSK